MSVRFKIILSNVAVSISINIWFYFFVITRYMHTHVLTAAIIVIQGKKFEDYLNNAMGILTGIQITSLHTITFTWNHSLARSKLSTFKRVWWSMPMPTWGFQTTSETFQVLYDALPKGALEFSDREQIFSKIGENWAKNHLHPSLNFIFFLKNGDRTTGFLNWAPVLWKSWSSCGDRLNFCIFEGFSEKPLRIMICLIWKPWYVSIGFCGKKGMASLKRWLHPLEWTS